MPDPTPPTPIHPAGSAPTDSSGVATADERELAASIDALMAAGKGTTVDADAGAGALDAVQSVEDLLADVAAELTQPVGDAATARSQPSNTTDTVHHESPAAPHTPGESPEPASEIPTDEAGSPSDLATADEMLAAVAADLAADAQAAESQPSEPESWQGLVSKGQAHAPGTSAEPIEPRGGATMARDPGMPAASIDDLDQTLAESAEQVLADGQKAAAASIAQTPREGAGAATPEPAASDTPSAPPAAQPEVRRLEPSTARRDPAPAAPAAPAAAPAMSAPAIAKPSLLARGLMPLADRTAALSPTVRQTISWLAVYTALLAVGVWGFLLVRGPAKALEPTTDPTPFLKPGDVAPPPSSKGHDKSGHDDGHADDGHGAAKKTSDKDSHGGDGHGAPKKAAKAKDAHGAPKAADKKKPADKKDAAKKDPGHH